MTTPRRYTFRSSALLILLMAGWTGPDVDAELSIGPREFPSIQGTLCTVHLTGPALRQPTDAGVHLEIRGFAARQMQGPDVVKGAMPWFTPGPGTVEEVLFSGYPVALASHTIHQGKIDTVEFGACPLYLLPDRKAQHFVGILIVRDRQQILNWLRGKAEEREALKAQSPTQPRQAVDFRLMR